MNTAPTEQRKDFIVELAAAKRPDGTPWLYRALHDGCADAIKAYASPLKLLSPEQMIELVEDYLASWQVLSHEFSCGNNKIFSEMGEIYRQAKATVAARSVGTANPDPSLSLWGRMTSWWRTT